LETNMPMRKSVIGIRISARRRVTSFGFVFKRLLTVVVTQVDRQTFLIHKVNSFQINQKPVELSNLRDNNTESLSYGNINSRVLASQQ
jgi:hypothetical protein